MDLEVVFPIPNSGINHSPMEWINDNSIEESQIVVCIHLKYSCLENNYEQWEKCLFK